MAKLIETVDLVTNFYTYEGVVRALDKVSLSVDHGCTFGLVGESGCGKSVTVRSMMRIVQAPGRIDSGRVLFYPEKDDAGRPVDLLQQSEAYMKELRGNKISMVFQEPNAALNPIMSIGDQVAESFLFHSTQEMAAKILKDLDAPGTPTFVRGKTLLKALYGLAARRPESLRLKLLNKVPLLKRWNRRLKREALRRAVEIIAKLGIPNAEDMVKRYPHNLSGGMKQRIVIAIALACNPLLLIADEATSNLDVTIQAQILQLLKELRQKEISSVILITHDLGIVAETCDRVGVMYAGNLCEVADARALFQNPRHPYTRALLRAVPQFSHEGALQSIEGGVPNLVAPPSGCRFHPRCPRAMDICRRAFPAMTRVGAGHRVACYLYTDKRRDDSAATGNAVHG
jgi:peptide/nickel transport system ATP-binding protein